MKQSFTRSLFVSMLMVFGLTTAWAQKSVLNESFTGSSLPAGWTAGENWDFTEGNAKFFAPFENGADTLVTPLLSLSELDNVPSAKISYSLAANTDKVNEFKVLYRASADADWAEWKSFAEATDGQVTVKDALPAGLQNIQIAIAGAYKGGGDSRIYSLSVENKTEAADAPTGLKTEDLTTTSVTLYWDKCSSQKFVQYNVKINSAKMTDMSATADVVDNVGWMITDEFYELTGLTPNTEYWLYVQYDCGDGDLSPWAELSFKTPCEAISAPFAEDFEGAISGCYTIIEGSTAAEVSGEYAYNSQKAFKSNSAKAAFNYFILPEFNGEVKNFQVSFMAASADGGNTYARTVTIGVCAEPTAESFTEVKKFDLPKGRVWEQIIVSLKGYAGTGKYIAFKLGNEEKENRLFIDDIKIETTSACPKPMFVEVAEITPTTAKLSWTETGNASEWNLVLSTKPLADPENIEPDAAKGEFAGSISANPYTASNLQPNTTYFAYLQAGCGSSEWTSAVEFKTSRPVLFPYSEHFDRMNPDKYTNDVNAVPDGWVMDCRNAHVGGTYYDQQPTASSYNTFVPYVVTSQNHESTAYVNAAMQLKGQSDGTGSTSANVGIAIMPAMPENVTIKDLMVSFWALSTNGTQTIAVGVAKNQDNSLQKGKQLGENITLVNTATIPANEWTKCKVLMKAYEGEGRYIVFSIVPPSTGTPTIYIDDIEIDYAPDCNAVSTLSAEATGIDKATVTWTDASSSTSWTIKVSSTEIDPSSADGDIVAAQTVNAKTYNIEGLSMGKTYYIYVSPICGDAWMNTSVTTLVGLQIPYYNDFTDEYAGTGANRGPKNWKTGLTNTPSPAASSTYQPYVYGTAWTTPPADVVKNCLRLYNYTTTATGTSGFPYAIMPELLNADAKDLKMSFYAYHNNTTTSANYAAKAGGPFGLLKVGVVKSLDDINKTDQFKKVTEIATIRCAAGKKAEKFIIDFSGYTGDGKYIVFYSDTAKYNDMQIDNLSITLASAPQKITDLTVSAKTETTATFTWTENGNAAKWDVRVFDAEQENPDEGTPAWAEQVTVKTATATGLKHSTQYYAYARSVQDNGNGEWVSVSFWTVTGAWPLPYAEDFSAYMATSSYRSLPMYYDILDANGASMDGGQVYVYINNLGGDKYLKMQATSTTQYKITTFAFPPFDKPLNTLQMTFIARSDASATATESGQQTAIDQSHTEIGVLEADGTFVPLYSFKVKTALEWEDHYMNFQGYTGAGGKIAVRMNYNKKNATNAIRLLNFKITEMPECGRLMGVEVSELDSISATLSWGKSKAETKWNLKVSTKKLTDPENETADIFDGQMDVQTKDLTGLVGNTNYYVYIQTVDEANACVGDWSSATVFRTLCQLQKFPYYEDFQSYEQTGAGNIPDCSTLSGQDVNHSYIASRGATGNKALYLRQVTKDHHNYFAFPALLVDNVKRLQLNMMVNPGSTTATNYYYYEVGVMTDPENPSTFVSVKLDSVQGAAATVFNEKKYTFENYTGDEHGNYGTYIALKPLHYKNPKAANYYAGYVYIDEVTIDFIETCFAPSDVKADSMGINGVKLIWSTDDETATHRVRIFDNADAEPNDDTFIAEAVVNKAVAILEGLTGNKKYYAYVRKECGGTDGNSKWSLAYEFKTNCPSVQPIPYADGFESYDAQTIPDCWTALDNGTNAKCRVYATSSSTTYSSAGKNGLYINYASVGGSSGNSYYQSSIVTPELDVDNLNELLVCFDYTSISRAGGILKIEAVSDDTPDAQAIIITQISDMPKDQWKKAYILLKDYYTSVMPYKRLRFTPMAQGTSVCIDELLITKDLNTIIPVRDLKLQMVTENSIKFSFAESTPWIKEWQVAYTFTGGNIADATVKTIAKTEYTIEGLAANTNYDIYVRGNVEGDEWIGPLSATTLQVPASIPYITGFDDDNENALWAMYNVKTVQGAFYPNFWIVGDAAKCAGSGDKALFVTNDSASYEYYTSSIAVSAAASEIWAMRNIKFEEAGTYKFSFRVKAPANTQNESDYATAHLFPAGAAIKGATATMLDGTTRSGGAVTDVPASNIYSLMGKTYHQNEWIWVTKSMDVEEAGVYSLAIYWYNASVGAQKGQPVAVDSVLVEEYLCTTPKNFEFTNRAATEVSFKWFGGKCKNFEYVLSRYANLGNPALIDAEDKIAAGTISDGPQVTIGNLLPSTNYSLYVRTLCPDGETDWVEYDFNTPCALEELPYTEGFFETPECWILKSATVGKTSVGTSAEHEDWYRLLLASGGYAILPELAIDLKNVEVEIGLFNTTTNFGAVSLGVMDNTYDMDTYEEVAFFQTQTKPGSTGTYTPTQLEVFNKMMNLYKGTGKVLAIKNATTNAIGVKYVTLTELPDCVRPQQVELTYPTSDAFTVNWIAGVEEAWEIKLNDSIIENVTENPYRIKNLEQGTIYTVAVRALCDAEHTSEWSLPATIQTECGVNALPLFEDFSGLAKPATTTDLKRVQLTCWDNMVSKNNIDYVFSGADQPFVPASNVYVGDVWVSNWISALGDYAQLHSYRRDGPTYRHKWLVSPQYAIEGKATLSFDIRCCNNVGNAPAPSSDRTIVAVSTDNGATWKAENATLITDIDSVYSTKSVSLDKFAGQTIRIAFYDENITSSHKLGQQPFVLIDNVRMNCADEYPVEGNACQGNDYEGFGFSIAKEDIPVAGEDSIYYRFAANAQNGCDSVIALKLTTHTPAPEAIVYDTICEGEVYDFGGQGLTKPNPEGQPYKLYGTTEYGCDSIITLYLAVNKSDTAKIEPIEIKVTQLPYQVDEHFLVPAEAAAGVLEQVVKVDGCQFNLYTITIKDVEDGLISVTGDIDHIDIYDILGRKVVTLRQGDAQHQLPTGVYMLVSVTNDGKVLNTRATVK